MAGLAVAVTPELQGDYEVEFVGPDGLRREALRGCWNAAFERAAPVPDFPSFRGQKNWPGWWWFSRTGEHVGYESWVERDTLMACDADPNVVAVASQPMWLHWIDERGRPVRHAPDFYARPVDGTGVVIDVRPEARIREADAAVFAATARICAEVGWQYRREGELQPTLAANLRWLAGYRHPRFLRPPVVAALREAFAEPAPLLAGARVAGDPLAVLPVLFALLWRRVLHAEIGPALLGPDTLVQIAADTAAAPGRATS